MLSVIEWAHTRQQGWHRELSCNQLKSRPLIRDGIFLSLNAIPRLSFARVRLRVNAREELLCQRKTAMY